MKVDPMASYDPYLNVTITLSLAPGASSTPLLNLRIPSWVSGVATSFYNTEPLVVPPPGSFLTVAKTWKSGDNLTLALPMAPRLEAIKDDRPEFATTQAVLYVPYLLAGLTEDDWAIKTAVFQLVPGLNGQPGTVSLESISFPGCFVYSSPANVPLQSAKLSCGNGSNDFKQGTSQYHPISFIAVGPKRNYVMQPLNTLQDEYYNVYFDIQQ